MMARRSRLAWLLAASLFSAPIVAQTLSACRVLPDDAERLACYDRLAGDGSPGMTAKPAAEPPAAGQGIAPPSPLGAAWELDPGQRGNILRLRPYKPVYILPYFHSRNVNDNPNSPAEGRSSQNGGTLSDDEAKFQVSFKSKLAEDLFGDNGDLWFGYTQTSRWQVYSPNQSSPFRETDYEPEVMLVWRTDYSLLGWRGRALALGINHQSNGRGLPLSRSWNRVVAAAAFERDDWTLTLRPWWRIPEGSEDDNPDISNYLGRADIHLLRRWGGQQLSLLLRHSLRLGGNSHGAVQLDYAFPIAGQLRGHLQWFSGYGESLIDYNYRGTYYGIGVSLIEW
jgi:phospholipase A1